MSSGMILTSSADSLTVIDCANLAESTKRQYERALKRYFRETGSSLTNVDTLVRYAQTLPDSSRAFLKAAVRTVTEGMATSLKGQATPTNVNQVQAALYRIEALQDAVKVKQSNGTKPHIWLTHEEVRRLLDTCESGIVGQRDRVLLGLLVAAGLRRQEAANLRFEDVRQQPINGKDGQTRTVLAVRGKGAKDRVVPISDALAEAIEQWAKVVGGEGHIARSLGRKREPGESISGQGILNIVAKRGHMIGKPELQPHDLRRTYAQLGYEAGVPITQVSRLLGHASIATTQRYLNLDLDLETTISDFVPF